MCAYTPGTNSYGLFDAYFAHTDPGYTRANL